MNLVAGFGFRRGATLPSLRDALRQALTQAPQATAITLLATAHDKAAAPGLRALAAELGLPVCAVPHVQMAATPTTTDHAVVRARRGTGSTAEAAALAAARLQGGGDGATLLQPRAISTDRQATCALASFAAAACALERAATAPSLVAPSLVAPSLTDPFLSAPRATGPRLLP